MKWLFLKLLILSRTIIYMHVLDISDSKFAGDYDYVS